MNGVKQRQQYALPPGFLSEHLEHVRVSSTRVAEAATSSPTVYRPGDPAGAGASPMV